ncbi:MAG: metal-dependent hydrolase [Synergistaceae bacterium]|nr:metal-dependent hydrolase [Synergistota bacterium]NLM72033.1 metal-dependent hydrolase [Synergistaceae bacterium]
MAKLRFLGHSAFEVTGERASILIDPFITGNPAAAVKSEDIADVDYILVTHGHGDHLGDAEPLALRTGATVIANHEICTYLEGRGVKCHSMHIGGSYAFPFGRVKMTPALHGSDIETEDGLLPGGNPCGFLLEVDGETIYHAGDTGLTMDMQLLSSENVKVALLPIGGNYTMDVNDAAKAVDFIRPEIVVPMHYDTFPVIAADPSEFIKAVAGKAEVRVIKPGETLTL